MRDAGGQLAAVASIHAGDVATSEASPGTCFLKLGIAQDGDSFTAMLHAAAAYTQQHK